MPSPFTPQGATANGTRLTVDAYLRQPQLIARDLSNLTFRRFISNYLFSQGESAASGSILYQQITENDVFTDRDVKEIAEGDFFPVVNTSDRPWQSAVVAKYGGAIELSYERVRRDSRSLLGREMIRLGNTIIRKANRLAVHTLVSDPNVQTLVTAGGTWDGTSTKIRDLATAMSMINDLEMGYEADTVLLHPTNALELHIDQAVTDRLPRESVSDNPLLNRELSGLMGLNFITSNDVPEGQFFTLSRLMVGSYHNEDVTEPDTNQDDQGTYTRVLNRPENEKWLIQGARPLVHTISDPKACVVVKGV